MENNNTPTKPVDMLEPEHFTIRGDALYDCRGVKVSNFHITINSRTMRLDEDKKIGSDLSVDIHINGRIVPLSMPVQSFMNGGLMERIYASLGSEAILYGSEKLLRLAAQEMSPQNLPTSTVYASHGFTLDGTRYLSQGLEITSDGFSKGAEFDTSMGAYTSRIAMVIPPDEQMLLELGKHLVKDFFELKFHSITYPLVGHLALAPFASMIHPITGRQKPAMHLQGASGGGKTFLAGMALRFFGNFGDRFLSWISTANSIEADGYWLKDVLVVVDDFKEATSNRETLIRILQGHANEQGRGRLKGSGKTEEPKYIRGLLLSTGEDFVESVESVSGRTMILEVEPEQNQQAGRRCLVKACQYSMFLPGLIHNVISSSNWKEDFRREVDEISSLLQEELPSFSNGARIASNWALNAVGFKWFVDYLASIGALDREKHRSMLEEYYRIVQAQIQSHAEKVLKASPAEIFFEVIGQRLATGAISIDGVPGHGKKIGKLSRDGGKVGLFPDEVMRVIRSANGKSPFTKDALKAALLREGILEKSGDRVSAQMRFDGRRVQTWQLKTEDFKARCGLEDQ